MNHILVIDNINKRYKEIFFETQKENIRIYMERIPILLQVPRLSWPNFNDSPSLH